MGQKAFIHQPLSKFRFEPVKAQDDDSFCLRMPQHVAATNASPKDSNRPGHGKYHGRNECREHSEERPKQYDAGAGADIGMLNGVIHGRQAPGEYPAETHE